MFDMGPFGGQKFPCSKYQDMHIITSFNSLENTPMVFRTTRSKADHHSRSFPTTISLCHFFEPFWVGFYNFMDFHVFVDRIMGLGHSNG